MNRPITRLGAVLAVGACISACGGKVVFDGTATGSGGGTASTTSNTSGTSSTTGSTASGACDAATHTIAISDFKVGCMLASDCVPVFIGNLCATCPCPFSAINVYEKMKYDAERQVKSVGAPPIVCDCPVAPVSCVMGTCVNHGAGG